MFNRIVDDDFDAFRALAHTTCHVDVMVNIEGRGPLNLPFAVPTPAANAIEIEESVSVKQLSSSNRLIGVLGS